MEWGAMNDGGPRSRITGLPMKVKGLRSRSRVDSVSIGEEVWWRATENDAPVTEPLYKRAIFAFS